MTRGCSDTDFYLPPSKLRKGNVFSLVCLSFCHQGGHCTEPWHTPPHTGPSPGPILYAVPFQCHLPPPPDIFKLVQLGPHCSRPSPTLYAQPPSQDIFKLVHYEAQTVCKGVVDITSKDCPFCCPISNNAWHNKLIGWSGCHICR